jgi:hypothetical protein
MELTDNNFEPQNRHEQHPGQDSAHKSSHKHETGTDAEKPKEENDDDGKFSPGEPDNYNAEEFSTD